MFSQDRQQKSKPKQAVGRAQTGGRKLYSIPAWLDERVFSGTFSLGSTDYKLVYTPLRAEAMANKLQLIGRLTMTDAHGRARTLDSVRATLASTQGGIGTTPSRRQLATAAPTGAQVTSQQQQQLAGETEKQADDKASGQAKGQHRALPDTENTGPTSYCGVLYFHFEPLDAQALAVAADFSKVQLNVRLAPLDDTARTLHGLYCYVVDALYGERIDEKLAADAINALNRVFAG